MEPENSFEYSLRSSYWSVAWNNYVRWLLEQVQLNGKHYGDELLEIIEQIDQDYVKILE